VSKFIPTFVVNYLWLWFIIGTAVNVYVNHVRIRKSFTAKPHLRATADHLNRGFALFGSLPWVVMAIGIFTGQVGGVGDFFGAAQGIPFVRYWYLMMGCVFVLGTWWIFLGTGAKRFSEVGRQLNSHFSPTAVRWAWVGILVWNLVLGSGMYFDALGLRPKLVVQTETKGM
jgi:hypothetical protein